MMGPCWVTFSQFLKVHVCVCVCVCVCGGEGEWVLVGWAIILATERFSINGSTELPSGTNQFALLTPVAVSGWTHSTWNYNQTRMTWLPLLVNRLFLLVTAPVNRINSNCTCCGACTDTFRLLRNTTVCKWMVLYWYMFVYFFLFWDVKLGSFCLYVQTFSTNIYECLETELRTKL